MVKHISWVFLIQQKKQVYVITSIQSTINRHIKKDFQSILGGSSQSVSGLQRYNPSYKWINPTYHIYSRMSDQVGDLRAPAYKPPKTQYIWGQDDSK